MVICWIMLSERDILKKSFLKMFQFIKSVEFGFQKRLGNLIERVGITPANLSILKTGKAKAIRFSTLEAICKELGCQPGDILEYVPD